MCHSKVNIRTNLFQYFSNDLMFFVTETKICYFADDNIICSCSATYNEANQNLSNDIQVVLDWS